MKLRPYQQETVNAVYRHLRERDDNPCVVLPTASGKSWIIAQIATDAVSRWGGRVLVLAHVKELLSQNAEKIRLLCPNIDVGVYSAGLNRRDTTSSVIVAGIQSIYRRACELDAFDLIIVDECHRIAPDREGIYQRFLKDAKLVNPNVRLIGLTATPYRMKSGMICGPDNLLNAVCYEAGIKELIVQGYRFERDKRLWNAKRDPCYTTWFVFILCDTTKKRDGDFRSLREYPHRAPFHPFMRRHVFPTDRPTRLDIHMANISARLFRRRSAVLDRSVLIRLTSRRLSMVRI